MLFVGYASLAPTLAQQWYVPEVDASVGCGSVGSLWLVVKVVAVSVEGIVIVLSDIGHPVNPESLYPPPGGPSKSSQGLFLIAVVYPRRCQVVTF